MALDIAASLMIIPGLEGRIGYALKSDNDNQHWATSKHFSVQSVGLGYNPGKITQL